MRIVLLLVVVLAFLTPSLAATPAEEPMVTPGRTLTWQGAHVDVGAVPHAAACTPMTCDTFTFRVSLAEAMRAQRAPALEVSIRWGFEQNDFDLFLYDASGALVAESTGMISIAEGLLLPDVAPGVYTAVVVPATVVDSAYEGLVELEFAKDETGDLLPNLVALPPAALRIVAPVYFTATPIEVGGNRPASCGADETIEGGVLRCLRFNTAIANRGGGALEARFNADGVPAGMIDDEQRRIVQRVYRGDGTHWERDAGMYTFHAVHAHFHYEDFAEHILYQHTADGLAQVKEGRKAGFCMVDVALDAWGEPGNGPRTYKAPVCLAPTQTDASGSWLVQGITAGWADIYTWDLPDQYVDITGLGDGCYRLVTSADPSGYFLETRADDNAAGVDFTLSGDDVVEGC